MQYPQCFTLILALIFDRVTMRYFSVLYPEVALQKESKIQKDSNKDDKDDDFIAPKETRSPKLPLVASFANFITQLSLGMENEQVVARMGVEEKLEMFKVAEKYSKGSVEVARGKKMTVLPHDVQHTKRHDKVCKIVDGANTRCTRARTSCEKEGV